MQEIFFFHILVGMIDDSQYGHGVETNTGELTHTSREERYRGTVHFSVLVSYHIVLVSYRTVSYHRAAHHPGQSTSHTGMRPVLGDP